LRKGDDDANGGRAKGDRAKNIYRAACSTLGVEQSNRVVDALGELDRWVRYPVQSHRAASPDYEGW